MLDILGNRTAYPEVKEVLEKLSHRMTLCIGSTSDTAPLLQDLEKRAACQQGVYFRRTSGL